MEKLNIAVILGSTRDNRFGDKAANWITEIAKKKEGVEIEFIDVKELNLPIFEGSTSPAYLGKKYDNESVTKWSQKVDSMDAFIVVAAEYNHGYTPLLKNALDSIYPEWNNKAIGFVGYGSVGGGRSVEQLRTVAIELQMAPIRNGVHIMAPWLLTDESGLKNGALDQYVDSANGMIDQLIWWAKALKVARG